MFSGLPRTVDIGEYDWHVSVVPILLQKSAIITAKRLTAIF
jgi:hypothetical protein